MTSPQKRGAVTRRINLAAKQQRIAEAHGVDSMPQMLTALYAKHHTTAAMGKIMGCNKVTVRNWMRQHGVKINSCGGPNNPGGYAKKNGNGRKPRKAISRNKAQGSGPIHCSRPMRPSDVPWEGYDHSWLCLRCRHRIGRDIVRLLSPLISRHGDPRGHNIMLRHSGGRQGDAELFEDVME